MARIQVLDKMVAELIAAGEVVERPASVVKELVENSIDSGATKIIVEIKGGGIGYIRITDNGCGIDKDDIKNAFKRHATSKVFTADDLNSIDTLGFRGEALASISAVAKVEIMTKTKDSLDGWSYEIKGTEEVMPLTQVGTTDGTTIIIRDIFYNTPARMKFLRSDVSEGNAVANVVDKCAFSHPEISFTFIRDTKTKLQTSGNNDLLAVISKIYDRDFAKDMLKVDYNHQDKVRVYGYVGKPNNVKPTRTYQNFFINGRYVRTTTCSVALQEAFKGKLMTGKFPVCVLFIDLDSSKVDANVHPAKIEVRFSEEKEIYSAVYFGVKNSLLTTERPISEIATDPKLFKELPKTETKNQNDMIELKTSNLRPFTPKSNYKIDIEVDLKIPKQQTISPIIREEINSKEMLNLSSSSKNVASNYKKDIKKDEVVNIQPIDYSKKEEVLDTIEISVKSENEASELLKFVGELFNTYILLENQDNQLLIVDKHAAHERMIYEEIKNNSELGNRQVLISPITVTLQREEYAAILDNIDILEDLGFLVEDFGTGTLIVRETGVLLDGNDIKFTLSEIASKLIDGNHDLNPEILNRLYYSMACKAAVRGGDKNNKQELMEIIKRLEANPEITHCPHGRPVTIKLSRKEIEKMFGRLG